ncbi:MAG: heavy metal translocating P-type ATPase, partial [Lachnospiraceae bacterium]|nr:heavy metal translocating P-type ATPase [Lachnospiraceae bacterium]
MFELNKKQKKNLIRIIVTVIILIAFAVIFPEGEEEGGGAEKISHDYLVLALYLIPYVVIGYDIIKKAVKGIIHGQVMDENFLMAVATVGAMALGEYREGVAV